MTAADVQVRNLRGAGFQISFPSSGEPFSEAYGFGAAAVGAGVALGYEAEGGTGVGTATGVGIGYQARGQNQSVAIGSQALASTFGIAIGAPNGAQVTQSSLGLNTVGGITAGRDALAGPDSVALGHSAQAGTAAPQSFGTCVAIGARAVADRRGTLAIGYEANATGPIEVGTTAQMAVGAQASIGVLGAFATALGALASSTGRYGTAVGWSASVTGTGGTAIGTRASAAQDGLAIGRDALAGANQARIGSTLHPITNFGVVGTAGGLFTLNFLSAPAALDTGLVLFINDGAVAQRTVRLDAAGTGPGGAGRALYVDN